VLLLQLLVLSPAAFSQSSDCLSKTADFAERICGEIQRSGNRQVVEANGQLKAEVSGIVRRIVGEAGGSANGKFLRETYENVLQQDLGKEIFSVRECRMKMVDVGTKEACKTGGPATSCRTFPGSPGACMCMASPGQEWTGPGSPICATSATSGSCSCDVGNGHILRGSVQMN
jgi:hypothetical protein